MNFKKLTSVVALASAFGLVACDESSSPSEASAESSSSETEISSSSEAPVSSEAEIVSSSSEAVEVEIGGEDFFNDNEAADLSSSSTMTLLESSSSEMDLLIPSSSSIQVSVDCDIDYDSDTWSFTANSTYNNMNVEMDAKTSFEGTTATATISITMVLGSDAACQVFKQAMASADTVSLGEEVEDPEEEELNMTYDCVDGNLVMSTTEVEENITEEVKKETYDSMVKACEEASSGDLNSLFDDEDED